MADGIEFFISTNNVILSRGDKNNTIEVKYFKSVKDKNGKELLVI